MMRTFDRVHERRTKVASPTNVQHRLPMGRYCRLVRALLGRRDFADCGVARCFFANELRWKGGADLSRGAARTWTLVRPQGPAQCHNQPILDRGKAALRVPKSAA